jgi:hypothetical protein
MKPFTRIASFIFGIICLLHIVRLLTQGVLIIGTWEAPVWISFFGVAITAILCIGLWRESKV